MELCLLRPAGPASNAWKQAMILAVRRQSELDCMERLGLCHLKCKAENAKSLYGSE